MALMGGGGASEMVCFSCSSSSSGFCSPFLTYWVRRLSPTCFASSSLITSMCSSISWSEFRDIFWGTLKSEDK